MKKINFIAILLISFCSTSCARLNLGRSSASPEVTVILHNDEDGDGINDSVDEDVAIKGDRQDGGVESGLSWSMIIDRVEKSDSVVKRLDFDVTNYSEFTKSEISHVAKCDYDPFNGLDELYFNMNQLKENYCYPVNGEFLSDYGIRSGRMHYGLDIRAALGEEIHAIFDGVVRMSKYYYGYGNIVVIRHSNGLESLYGHNSKNLVKSGDVIAAGDPIALGGRTGSATCTHVHFEVRVNGKPINPNFLIDPRKRELQNEDFYVYNNRGTIYATNKKRDSVYSVTLASKSVEESEKSQTSEVSAKKSVVKSKIHTIKKGDTLYNIARTNNTSVNNLCRINGITEKTVLQIGQKLKVG